MATPEVAIYLVLTKNTGPVLGESVSEHHPNAIDVQSYSMGVSNPVAISVGTGLGSGKASFSALNVLKRLDRSSPILLKDVALGTHFSTADLYVEDLTGRLITQVHLNDVFMESVQDSGGGQFPAESISMVFQSLFWTYYVQNPDGSNGTPTTGGWDAVRNISCPDPAC